MVVVVVAGIFTLARFSEGFLVLRAQNVGLSITLAPTVLVAMNIAYALAAYPAGVLADRTSRIGLLALGIILLIAADVVLSGIPTIAGVMIGAVLWGLHMGFTRGLFATLVTDASPPELRGTAFGYYNLITGLAAMPASVIAGGLWDMIGPELTFVGGALFAGAALLGLFSIRHKLTTPTTEGDDA